MSSTGASSTEEETFEFQDALHLRPTHSEEDGHHYYEPPSRSWRAIFANSLSTITGGHRSTGYGIASSSSTSASARAFDQKPPIHVRCTPKRATLYTLFVRLCLIVPILILVLFGTLHILQVLLGRASMLWDFKHDDFLPYWGRPGHFGEGLAHYPTDVTRDVIPIPCHSHNDYWRRVPLFEAIHFGCTGVEADVWLFDEELYVGHNTAALTRNRTFRSLYVDPLVDLLERQNPTTEFHNGNLSRHGVFDTDFDQSLVLLVDLKTDGRTTFPYVESQLAPLRERGFLTYFNGTDTIPGAITVVGTGNTPFDLVTANSTYRDIFFDAPLERLGGLTRSPTVREGRLATDSDVDADDEDTDLEEASPVSISSSGASIAPVQSRDNENAGSGQGLSGLPTNDPAIFSPANSYYASVSFRSAVGFVWRGHLNPRQMEILRRQIRAAKKAGLKARYWDTPAWPISLRNHVWHVLVKEGADILNVDDLRAAASFDWRRWRHDWW